MSPRPGRISLLLVLLAIGGGCHAPVNRGKSPLKLPVMSPDSVVLDVFFVRVPLGDVAVNEQLWLQVDEQHFPAPLRQRLGQNGFRVGLVGGQIPMPLSKLLELADKPVASGEANQIDLADMGVEPRVVRRHMPLRRGHPGDIVVSQVYDRLPVLLVESGRLAGGQTYTQAQAHLTVEAAVEPGGLVRLKLTPEVHHGQARMQPRPFVSNEAVFRWAPGKPRRVFEDLSFSATLSPGSMLLVGCLPERGAASLGHYFLTSDNGRPEQKLLVLRLSQTQHDDAFVASGVLDLPE